MYRYGDRVNEPELDIQKAILMKLGQIPMVERRRKKQIGGLQKL